VCGIVTATIYDTSQIYRSRIEGCGMKRKFTSPKFVTFWLDIDIFFLGRLVTLFLINVGECLKHEVTETESVLVQHF
jgi:hypothetical protein